VKLEFGVIFLLRTNVFDYLPDKKIGNRKWQLTPKLIRALPINTRELQCKRIGVIS